MLSEAYLLKRLELRENDIRQLKQMIAQPSRGEGDIISLKGVWQGANFTDEEKDEAKHSLFKEANGQ